MLKFQRNILKILKKQRDLSTWSPLANAFNSRPHGIITPSVSETGIFCVPELKNVDGFYFLRDQATNLSENLINEAVSNKRNRKMVQIFDELSDTLCKVADLAEFIRIAHPIEQFSAAAEDACISISGIVERLNTHKELYEALKNVVEHGDIVPTSDVDTHVSNLFLFDFEQSGIHLNEEERKRVVQLNDIILQLGQRFMNGTVQPTIVRKTAIPKLLQSHFPSEGNNIIISGLYNNSSNGALREVAYRYFLYPSAEQEALLSDLLVSRNDLAKTCGFSTYAQRALKGSTVETPETVNNFIDELNIQLQPRSEIDFDIMKRMKRSDSGTDNVELAAWDTPYYTSQLKRQILGASVTEYLPYFSLGSVMEGLNNLMRSLYGITLENERLKTGESWHNDIYKLAVMHETEGLLGYIYCDFFERPGKPSQDCHFTIQGGKCLSDGSYQLPIVVVMLSLSQDRWHQPTLLSPSRVDNLFHEMGHAMHSMLARTEYQHVTGTRCSTDFAEVPSILMEYFANDPRVLRTFTRHFKTNEPMSEAMLKRLCTSKNMFTASETQLQVFYSALDQVYHADISKHKDTTTETLKAIQEIYYPIPYVDNTAWQLRFSHLVGYGAKYYSYLISKTIASWIWQMYFEKDPFNRESGEKYRRNLLSHGGGIPSQQLISQYLKRDVTPKSLCSSLIHEIDVNNANVQIFVDKLNLKI